MKYIRYTKYTGDPSGEVDLQELVKRLSDFFLQSGFESQFYGISEMDPETGALFARSVLNNEFGGRVAFADLAGKQISYTADRMEFLGRNGTPQRPNGLELAHILSGKIGAGLDPCAALRAPMITVETVGFRSSQFKATCGTLLPVSAESATSASTTW